VLLVKTSHKWTKSLIESLESQCDPKQRAKILEGCGRNCISRNLIKKVKDLKTASRNMNEFLDKLAGNWKHLQRDKEDIYVVYPKCYCPLVRDYPETLSATWCNCSRGWIKELFESVIEKPVEVQFQKSIKQGDDMCKFKVLL